MLLVCFSILEISTIQTNKYTRYTDQAQFQVFFKVNQGETL